MVLKSSAPGATLTRRRAFLFDAGQALAALLVLLSLLTFSSAALAARPTLVVPQDPDTVLERLPRGYAALMPSPRPVSDPLLEAEQLLATAAATGDARLAARADALLEQLAPNSNSDRILRARAFSAQHRHAFAEAVTLLDQLLERSPRDGDARLSRAQIHTLGGEFGRARGDCATLALGVDAGRGLLCAATLALRLDQHVAATRVLDRWLAQAAAQDPARRYALVMRGEIASRAPAGDADRWFQEALRLAPQDVRTLSAYARHLRQGGRHREIMGLLSNAPDHDGLALQRALAAHALRLPSSQSLIEGQVRRYALARALGSTPELRDEAELALVLQGDSRRALLLAEDNFRTQRDHEDVDILLRSAQATGDTAALQRLRRWSAAHALALPATPARVP